MKQILSGLINGQASKSLVVILTTVASALALYYGNAKWEPLAIMLIGLVIHYLVPNTPASTPPEPLPPVTPGGV